MDGSERINRDDVRVYAVLHAALNLGVPADLRDVAYVELGKVAARLDHGQIECARQLSRKLAATASSTNCPQQLAGAF